VKLKSIAALLKKPFRAKALAASVVAASSFCCSMPALAALVQISYAGQLTDVSGSMLGDFFGPEPVLTPAVGSTFKGGFIFNLNTPDSNAASNVALYTGGNSQFYVDFGLDANNNSRKYVQDINLPYNHGEVGNDVSVGGSPTYDVWTAYGQLANTKGYDYVETGMIFVSFYLNSLLSGSFPDSVILADFVLPDCDPSSVSGNGFSCARDMEFHAKKDASGNNGIYGDVDIYGRINEFAITRIQDNQVPEPGTLALAIAGLAGVGYVRRKRAAR